MIFGMEPVMSRANLIRKSEIVRRVVRAHTYYFGEGSVSTKVPIRKEERIHGIKALFQYKKEVQCAQK